MVESLFRLLSEHIQIFAVRLVAAEHAYLIAAGAGKPAVGYEEVIISAFLVPKYVGSFNGIVSAAKQSLAVIRIHAVFGIGFRVDHLSCLFVQLQQEDAAAPGAIDHPQPAVRVIEHRRVDRVREILETVFVTFEICFKRIVLAT